MSLERRRTYYRGRVQGVGFRATVERLADGFEVVGFVRNLDDGRVELLAEGETQTLDSFLDAISRRFDNYIRGTDVHIEPADEPPMTDFTTRY